MHGCTGARALTAVTPRVRRTLRGWASINNSVIFSCPLKLDKVEHFEIPADDHDRALRFYVDVFGWQLNPIPGVSYTRLLTKRVSENDLKPRPFEVNGAVVARDKERMSPVITISVTDMDATLARIQERGGKVVKGKTPFGSRGFTAYFQDTEGNVLGLWQVAPPT